MEVVGVAVVEGVEDAVGAEEVEEEEVEEE